MSDRIELNASLLLATALLAALLLTGCASQPGSTEKPFVASEDETPPFTQIEFVSQEVVTALARGESAESRTQRGATTGAIAGAGAGMAAAVATCAGTGPLAGLCLASYLGFYGLIGMTAGGLAGATYGFSGLSHEDQLYVNEALSRIDQQRDFQKELEQAVIAGGSDLWAPGEQNLIHVAVSLETIDLSQRSKGDLQMAFKAAMVLSWEDPKHGFSVLRIGFRSLSVKQPVDSWLENGGHAFAVAIDKAIEELATSMLRRIRELRDRSPDQTAQRAS